MRILIAEDNEVSSRILQAILAASGHEVTVTRNGEEAWAILKNADSPSLAILDWMMPGINGLEVCRRLREKQTATPVYIILLTANASKPDIVRVLEAGANDYILKPFDREELRARIKVGESVVNLMQNLALRISELDDILARVGLLQGVLPICSYCKNIRDDENYWQQLETYISSHTEAQFSHGICPSCYDSVIKPQLDKLSEKENNQIINSGDKIEHKSF